MMKTVIIVAALFLSLMYVTGLVIGQAVKTENARIEECKMKGGVYLEEDETCVAVESIIKLSK